MSLTNPCPGCGIRVSKSNMCTRSVQQCPHCYGWWDWDEVEVLQRPTILGTDFWTSTESPIIPMGSLSEMPELRALLLPQDWYQDMADFDRDLSEAPTDGNPWAPDHPEFDPADYIRFDGQILCVFRWGRDRWDEQSDPPPVVKVKQKEFHHEDHENKKSVTGLDGGVDEQ
ncbi:uncharacterized protein A1O9_04087 [Exophiala aquamarina CBS 119918]|uniref:Uncharacterized protein n=1 Tax=Exophiala aquamarina CBS 119918 TaxID=1182545 RepID=A0A072PIW2_9EURO|nr:uncharacterized protein A1O9_04087 [Exophiala aquamarina CBS 119918]KEF59243.1 hypothetical protein A1O9_04087 [Exophiala aquamarina CBS 119918]